LPAREWNARVVTDAAQNQMVADQNRILHRAAWNHARLHQRALDEQKHQNHPEPGDNFAPNFAVQHFSATLFSTRMAALAFLRRVF